MHTITVDEYEEMYHDGLGMCSACYQLQVAEPDAQGYTCDECGEAAVDGPYEWLMSGRVCDDD